MIGGSHYDTLGLPPDATPAEIREAFTGLAAAYRVGDRSSYVRWLEAEEAIAVLRKAYETLRDPKRRAQYDWRLGIDDLQPLDWGGAMPEPHRIEAPGFELLVRPRRPPLTPREWLCALKLLRRRALHGSRARV
jgi:curved DNA-binding protein CbpA